MVRSQSRKRITRFVRPQPAGSQGTRQNWGRAIAGLGEPPRPMSGGSVNGPAFARLALVLRKRTQRFHEAHEKPPSGGGLIRQGSCAGRNRTYDLQVMSLAS